jgi:hypothetical protein
MTSEPIQLAEHLRIALALIGGVALATAGAYGAYVLGMKIAAWHDRRKFEAQRGRERSKAYRMMIAESQGRRARTLLEHMDAAERERDWFKIEAQLCQDKEFVANMRRWEGQ